MRKHMILFDMDGVLLIPGGYSEALKSSVARIGLALGMPFTGLTEDHIARFEALSITNEWDTLAICTALILLSVWQSNPKVRLNSLAPIREIYSDQPPDYDGFLDTFSNVGSLPTCSAYEKIIKENSLLDESLRSALKSLLFNARDIYQSPVLKYHQETVLGSESFQVNYQLLPQMGVKSYLLEYDRPALSTPQYHSLQTWMLHDNHKTGIMTNRPSRTPQGYLSSPEAELGAKLVGLSELPLLGSGLLGWFAVMHCQLPDHTFLKPNPVHALALMQMCYAEPANKSLQLAYDLWQGVGEKKDWIKFHNTQITIIEDAVKGFESGLNSRALLAKNDVDIDLKLIGVSINAIKKAALQRVADQVYSDINDVNWDTL